MSVIPFVPATERDGAILRGVRLLPEKTSDGFQLPEKTLACCIRQFAGQPVYLSPGQPGGRTAADRCGTLFDVRLEDGRLVSDVTTESQPSGPLLLALIDANQPAIALHVEFECAVLTSRQRVTQVLQVESIGLVVAQQAVNGIRNLYRDPAYAWRPQRPGMAAWAMGRM